MCIGFLDANTAGCIVDASMAPVPVGVAGELLISGPKVGKGECSCGRRSICSRVYTRTHADTF